MKSLLSITILLLSFIKISFSQEIEVITQEKIQGIITILTYSPDGSLIASGSAKENTIKIWDLNSGKIIGKLEGHDGATTSLQFNKDGTKLVSSSKDELLILWDIVNWEIIDSVDFKSPITSMANDHNNPDIFYTGSFNGKVNSWSYSSLQNTQTLFSEEFEISQLDLSETHLVAGTNAGKISIFDLGLKEVTKSKKIHLSGIKGLKFYNNGQGLITTGGGGLVHLWNINDLSESKHFKAATSPITAFDANIENNRFVTASQNKKIKVWDLEGNEIFDFKTKEEENENAEPIKAIAISPDGTTIASSGFRRARSRKSKSNNNVIHIWDLQRGSLHKVLEGTVNPIYTFDFHPEKNELITLGNDRTLTFWDFNIAEKFGEFQLNEPKREIPPIRKKLPRIDVSTNPMDIGNKFKNKNFGINKGKLKDTGKNTGTKAGTAVVKRAFKEKPIVKYSSKGSYLITKLPKDEIRLYSLEKRKPEYKNPLWSYQLNINQMMCSPDEKYLAVIGSGDSAVSIINLETMEFQRKLYTPEPEGKFRFVYEANSCAFSPDGKLFAVCFNTSQTFVYSTSSWTEVFRNILPNQLGYARGAFVNFSTDGQYMVVNSMLGVKKYDTQNFNLFQSEKLNINGYSAPMDKPSDYAITIKDNYLYFENLFTGDYQKTLRVKPREVTNISVHPSGKIGITLKSGQFLIMNPEDGVEEIQLVSNGDNFIFKTSENYYKVSKEGYDLVTFRIGNQAYPFEQFDAVFNRPDLVLKKLGCQDEELMHLYELAYQKRIKKLGLQPTNKVSLQDIPTLKVSNSAEIPAITDANSVSLKLDLEDHTALNSYNVWVNNVPVYGKKGKSISGQKQELNEEVHLVHGVNKIQLSTRNKSGYESLMQTVYIEKTGDKPERDLYLITIGTSNYKDDRYNLTYAVKDAKDLVGLFSSNSNGVYREVKTKSLFDEDVTTENVEALKEFLNQSRPDDVVLVFVAGHGVLDENFDYYFGTHDMDFTNPKEKGLAYEKLEGILDGIAANKKILIMDTCHSGEIDKDDVFFAESTEEEENEDDISFRSVGASVETNESNATPSRLAGELFNDLRRGTGSTVISSAGGAEFAMESDEWKNGLFTYCLLKGLKNGTADLDGDGKIMLLELQEYVVERVTTLSHGKQIPNSRIQNMELDFRVW